MITRLRSFLFLLLVLALWLAIWCGLYRIWQATAEQWAGQYVCKSWRK